ncbi:MAG: GYF domain-containing protein [Planctomycetaceae bacterium]|nr:GYF domain-containing protein [Planctomycetaceae bacterium]
MASQWYYRLFGEEFGPVDETQLIELRDSGTIGPTDEVRQEGQSQFQSLAAALSGASTTAGSSHESAAADAAVDEANWFCVMLGQEMGPLTFAELADLARNGSLSTDAEVKFGVEGKYRRVGSIGRLVAILPYQDANTDIAPPTPKTASTPMAAAAGKAAVEASFDELTEFGDADFDGLTVTSPPPARTPSKRPTLPSLAADETPPVPPVPSAPAVERTVVERTVSPSHPPAAPAAVTPPAPANHRAAPMTRPAPSPAAAMRPSASGTGGAAPMGTSSTSPDLSSSKGAVPAKSARKRASSGAGLFTKFGSAFSDSVNVPALVALLVLGLIALWLFSPESSAPDRARLETLQTIFDEYKSNRENKAPAPQWEQFVVKSRESLATIKKELDGKSNDGHPYRRHIVWAASLLPKIWEAGRDKPSPLEAQLEYDLKKARFLLKQGPDPDLELPTATSTTTAPTSN